MALQILADFEEREGPVDPGFVVFMAKMRKGGPFSICNEPWPTL